MPALRSAALITGSTSGIGLAIALRLARSGYAVTLSYADDDSRAAAALRLCREADPSAQLVKADIGTADGAAALVRQAVEVSGRLDVLVNNAARVIDKPALCCATRECLLPRLLITWGLGQAPVAAQPPGRWRSHS